MTYFIKTFRNYYFMVNVSQTVSLNVWCIAKNMRGSRRCEVVMHLDHTDPAMRTSPVRPSSKNRTLLPNPTLPRQGTSAISKISKAHDSFGSCSNLLQLSSEISKPETGNIVRKHIVKHVKHKQKTAKVFQERFRILVDVYDNRVPILSLFLYFLLFFINFSSKGLQTVFIFHPKESKG